MNPDRVTIITIKNGVLMNLMESRGIKRISGLARMARVPQAAINEVMHLTVTNKAKLSLARLSYFFSVDIAGLLPSDYKITSGATPSPLLERELRVINYREVGKLTFKDISIKLGVSTGRARQIYVNAAKKLLILTKCGE